MSGKIREFYPGGYTSYGFYSFYDFIIDKDATRIFLIKGGAWGRSIYFYEGN